MTTERAINQTSQTGRTATHDAPRSFLFVNETVYMVVSLSNHKVQVFRPEKLQDPYTVDLRCSK